MSVSVTDIRAAFQDAELLLDGVLPALGHAELVPIADMLAKLGEKVAEAIAAKLAEAPALAAEVTAADAAADLAEKAKFP